jgi:DNA polymerase III epsilon subunit family exonuclease
MLTFAAFAAIAFLFYKFSRPKTPKYPAHTLTEQFVVFDLETTGLDPNRHEIIEIGAIKVTPNATQHEGFQALIKPNKKIPAKITEINGITNEMVDTEGRQLSDVLPEFVEFVGSHRLIAYNANFDMGFLQAAAQKNGIKVHNDHACALNMARRAWPGLPSYKLGSVAEQLNISPQGSHRALKDCEMAATVYMAAALKLKSLK